MKRIFFSLILLMLLLACSLPIGQVPATMTTPVSVDSQPTVDLRIATQGVSATQAGSAALPTGAAPAAGETPEQTSPGQAGEPFTRHFVDAYAGLGFDYPADWFINSPPDVSKEGAAIYIISLSPLALETPPEMGSRLPREDVPVIVIVAVGATAGEAINYPRAVEQRKAEYAAANPRVSIAAEEEIDLTGGGKATILYLSLPEGMQIELVTVIRGRRVIASALDQTESLLVFEAIAGSLREE